ncbi:amidohydrolase family protein [Robbsia sp. Bb-Pol-6]|uniref:Amidohydrolase family protein n=1 Tax=Robbsia betulipollinis TaxID=2981849 RepID=A0ABT3ZI32_9BURK|nr:amidohydrolase family protein [Robbsia betulipollinis]MCY0386185.1 amidohydrolase family protein [Robbsia betulipollinis]
MKQKKLPTDRVDSHAHVFLKDMSWTEGRRYAPSYDAPLALYRSLLAENAISHAVLVQPSFLGTDNRYLIDCLERHREQLRGVVVVEPDVELALLDEYDAKGVVGIRSNLIGKQTPDYASGAWRHLLKRLRTLDWHLEVQIEAARLSEIRAPILDSGVRLVIDHFGRPDPERGVCDPAFQDLLSLGKTGRVWVKISGAYRISPRTTAGATNHEAGRDHIKTTARTAYGMLKDAFGVGRLIWGSDWPHTSYESTENHAAAYALFNDIVDDPSDRQAILNDTPKALFGF